MAHDIRVCGVAEPPDAYPVHPTRVPQELIDARLQIAALQGEVIGLRAVNDELRAMIRRIGVSIRQASDMLTEEQGGAT